MEQVIEERLADTYHPLLTEMIRHLQQAVKEKSDVSISVSESTVEPWTMQRTRMFLPILS